MSADSMLSGERVESFDQHGFVGANRVRSVVIFTCGTLGAAAARALLDLNGVERVTVMQALPRMNRPGGLRTLRSAFKYGPMPGSASEVVQSAKRKFRTSKASGQEERPKDWFRVMNVSDFHDDDCIEYLRELAPDLGIAIGTCELQPSVFGVPRLGSLSVDFGKAPEYRGSVPAFWELFNGETQIGVTVSWLRNEPEQGPIVRQEMLPIEYAPRGDALKYVRRVQQGVVFPNGLRILVEAVKDVIDGRVVATQPDESRAKTYPLPTNADIRRLRRRVSHRHSLGYSRALRTALGWLLFRTGLYRLLIGNRAFVVLFHRVDDRYSASTITCSTSEFDAYCRFFSKYFTVVSLTSLADTLERNEACRGKLVVTFDDGYADNVAAARVMKQHGVTGCFYIATDFIGTDRNGWWDAEQGYRSHWMTWDDIRQLDAWNFELGAHTATHIDLGRASSAEAAAEIRESIDALESALNKQIAHFAYPFGGRENITPSNLELVKASGLRTCTSAYGGTVVPGSDRYNLRRVAVSPWHRSVWQLGLELLLTRNTGT